MSTQLRSLLTDAGPALEGRVADVTSTLLKDPEARLVSAEPSSQEVGQLLPTLKARAENASRSGTEIIGLSAVIQRLETMPKRDRILGYSVASPHAAGNVYFVAMDRAPVGAMIVRR